MKHFTTVQDVHDIDALIQRALQYKRNPWKDANLGKQKRIGLLFLNPSLRTRLSTQVAAQQLGMEAIVFNIDKEGWALEMQEGAIMNGTTVEHVKDAAPLLGAYFDILCIRTFPGLKDRDEDYSEQVLKQFMHYSGIPVVSLESSTLHPLQSLTDLITIHEHLPISRKPKIVLTWAPHVKALPQCVANSFAQWVNAWGKADFVITHPKGLELKEEFTKGASIIHDQHEALKEADFIYVKNWSAFDPYGQPGPEDPSWMLTQRHLQHSPSAKVMHCLPVRRNVELSDEILDSSSSLVTLQGSNRVWAAQAVLASILENN